MVNKLFSLLAANSLGGWQLHRRNLCPMGQRIAPQLAVEVIKRSDDLAGLKVLPNRWVVERILGWLMRQRHLVRDHTTTESSAVTWIYITTLLFGLEAQ